MREKIQIGEACEEQKEKGGKEREQKTLLIMSEDKEEGEHDRGKRGREE